PDAGRRFCTAPTCSSLSKRPAIACSSSIKDGWSRTTRWKRSSGSPRAAHSRKCSPSSYSATILSEPRRTSWTSWSPMRERLSVRHFPTRFLEHDLVSSNADRREILSAAGGALMAVSLFVSALIALQYQFANFLPPGITAARSLDERFLFVSASMLLMALL